MLITIFFFIQDELTQELDDLEQEILDSQLLGADTPPVTIPNVPTSEPGMEI
jgi:hypothetical protein